MPVPDRAAGTEIREADWYGEDLSGQEHTGVLFSGVDLTEATGDGAVFTDCTFRDCRFNLAQLSETAFLNCTFTGCSFFQTVFTDCKLVGSRFERCTFDLLDRARRRLVLRRARGGRPDPRHAHRRAAARGRPDRGCGRRAPRCGTSTCPPRSCTTPT